jgi:hypothetical protein
VFTLQDVNLKHQPSQFQIHDKAVEERTLLRVLVS